MKQLVHTFKKLNFNNPNNPDPAAIQERQLRSILLHGSNNLIISKIEGMRNLTEDVVQRVMEKLRHFVLGHHFHVLQQSAGANFRAGLDKFRNNEFNRVIISTIELVF